MADDDELMAGMEKFCHTELYCTHFRIKDVMYTFGHIES